nr:hypothetical protein CFP56_09496 [Quercus suber]
MTLRLVAVCMYSVQQRIYSQLLRPSELAAEPGMLDRVGKPVDNSDEPLPYPLILLVGAFWPLGVEWPLARSAWRDTVDAMLVNKMDAVPRKWLCAARRTSPSKPSRIMCGTFSASLHAGLADRGGSITSAAAVECRTTSRKLRQWLSSIQGCRKL